MNATRFVELQPWVSIIRMTGGSTVEQPREHWLDARGYDEVLMNIEVSYIDTGGSSLQVQTSVTDDPRAMVPMKDAGGVASLFAAPRAPTDAAFIVPASSTAPLRRWVRWLISGNSQFSVTFRITALLRNAGGG